MRNDIPVLIPAYNPPFQLIELVQALLSSITSTVVVVNDGSRAESHPVFEQIKNLSGVIYLEHSTNLGKGQALKTGFRAFKQIPNTIGVVTADADGQHTAEDVGRVISQLANSPDSLFLGARKFDKDIPWRSRFGNQLTCRIFSWLTGLSLQDTQTGLRGVPSSFITHLLTLGGDAYDYEMNMLITASQKRVPIVEIPIKTIYLNNNRASHFRPFIDSMKIYLILLRYVLSSLLAAIIDFGFFSLIIRWIPSITLSVLISRYVIGALVNFTINRSAVFHYYSNPWRTLGKYYAVATASGLLASGLIVLLVDQLHWSIILSKVVAELIFFPLGFFLQRSWVFKGSK